MEAKSLATTYFSHTTREALQQNLINDDSPLALFVDLSVFENAITALHTAFPSNFLHTFAVKSHPTLNLLKFVNANELGFETASMGELVLAIKAGARRDAIVFDSPVKTRKELSFALDHGVHVNLDNLQELERVKSLLAERKIQKEGVQYIGMRINPQTGAGSIAMTSTAVATSKFGVPLRDQWNELLNGYAKYDWLNALHVHVGSQGIDIDMAIKGIRAVVDLAIEINIKAGRQQITCIDIGGGLSVNFSSDEITPTFIDYATALKRGVPELFTGNFKVITEFGRSLVSKTGWFASRVEYTKMAGGRHIAAQHAGADLCVRTVYAPDTWPVRVTVLNNRGIEKEKQENMLLWDVSGPCCFSGDIIAHQRALPDIVPGDWLIVHDVGGYYHGSFSRYNCRQ
eukprot:Ihof_evm1s660 gene=Ihof_evmTU1s660